MLRHEPSGGLAVFADGFEARPLGGTSDIRAIDRTGIRKMTVSFETDWIRSLPQKIAVICSDGIGDCLHTVPMIRAVRRICPQAHIAVIAHPYSAPVLDRVAGIDEVLPLHPGFMSKASYYAALFDLRRERYRVSLDALRTSRSFMQTLVIGAAKRIGFQKKSWQSFAYTDLLPPNTRHDRPIMCHYAELLKPLGIQLEEDDRRFSLNLTDQDLERARELLTNRGLAPGRPYVMLQVTFSHHGRPPCREWPMQKFAEVARRIHHELGLAVVVASRSAAERPIQELIALSQAPVVNVAGVTPVPVLAAIIKGAAAYVGYDTGSMQIAGVVGTPIAAFFEIPYGLVEWKPWMDIPLRPIRSGPRCASCQRCKPNIDWCLQPVPAESLFEAARDVLQPPRR